MRSNFDFNQQKNFTRVHLQMIISVSQLISDVVGLSNSRFNESLSIINSYANNDKAMQVCICPTYFCSYAFMHSFMFSKVESLILMKAKYNSCILKIITHAK
jgi:hypothetical protein